MTKSKFSQLHRDLVRLKKLLTRHWVQGNFQQIYGYNTSKKSTCYCLVGGVGKVISGDAYEASNIADYEADTSPGKRTIALIDTLRKFIPKSYRHKASTYSSKVNNLINFNDARRRTEAQVIGVIDKALAATL